MKVLIVEDNEDLVLLLTDVIESSFDVELRHAVCLNDAISLLPWADLVISDFDFPTLGFLGLFPELIKANIPYILQSANPDNLRMYSEKQIGSIIKNEKYVTNMIDILDTFLNCHKKSPILDYLDT